MLDDMHLAALMLAQLQSKVDKKLTTSYSGRQTKTREFFWVRINRSRSICS
jgi:hypothetical protein